MKTRQHYLFIIAFSALATARAEPVLENSPRPIHLDDIHFVVTDEAATVNFFMTHFGAREMAHPGTRFELVRFLSLKWQDPTITITRTGPYDDLPADRNQRWLDATISSPGSEKAQPVYGARWLALATPSLSQARAALVSGGVEISDDRVTLPMEPASKAFSVLGPDGMEIVIVERAEREFGDARYAIDHIQFLVKDLEATQTFFQKVFAGQSVETKKGSRRLKVADAYLVISEPAALGLSPRQVAPRKAAGVIRIGLDHLGFLYQSVYQAVSTAETNGIKPEFQPQRYLYKGKPTIYTFTAFATPDDFTVEMVQAEGRVGPHSYYMDQNQSD